MKECYFGIRDPIIKDSLDSLSTIEAELPLVVGGLAVQLHAYNDPDLKRFSRHTPDLDILPTANLSYEAFSSTIYPRLFEFLRDKGYSVQSKRGRDNHTVIVKRNENKPDQKTFLVHWLEYPPELYKKMKDYFTRQIDCSRKLPSPSGECVLHVEAMEELIPLKVRRAIHFGRNRPNFVGPLYDVFIQAAERHHWQPLSEMPLHEWAAKIYEIQQAISERRFSGEPELVKTYKLNKDLYDICLSARVITSGFYQPEFDTEAYSQNLQRILFHKQLPEDKEDEVID